MTTMTTIALIGSLVSLAIGTTCILGESGYRFDLRRRSSRRRDDNRIGGRREVDQGV